MYKYLSKKIHNMILKQKFYL